jgi:hypothetical protein
MIEFLCGLGVGICLSIVYQVSLNLFSKHPSWTTFMNIKDDIATIRSFIESLSRKIPK